MLLNQRLGNGKAKPCAFAHTICRLANLVELVKDKFVQLLGDANPVVPDGDFDDAIATQRVDVDSSAVRREFHGVV